VGKIFTRHRRTFVHLRPHAMQQRCPRLAPLMVCNRHKLYRPVRGPIQSSQAVLPHSKHRPAKKLMERLPIETPSPRKKVQQQCSLEQLRARIAAACRRPEPDAIAHLLSEACPSSASDERVLATAITLIENARRQSVSPLSVNALMRRYPLSSKEGIALMCLAEALLRVPDTVTADALIADKIAKRDWHRRGGDRGQRAFDIAGRALALAESLVPSPGNVSAGPAAWAKTIVRRPLRSAMHRAMRMLGDQFICGQTIAEALANSAVRSRQGYRHSYDMLGEAAMTEQDAESYLAAYESALHAIGKSAQAKNTNGSCAVDVPGISVKLSALHPRYVFAQRDRVMEQLLPRLLRLVGLAKDYGVGLTIDAEEADRLELSLDLVQRLAESGALAGYSGFGMALQAYQKRCPQVIDYLAGLARHHGFKLALRLVKGAYWDTEIKRAQSEGVVDYPVYTRKVHTDLSYLVCAQKLLDATDVAYPQFATHNAHSIATIQRWANERQINAYEFQCLHGMGEALYDQLVPGPSPQVACRIYAPVGSHRTLLPYLVRRLLENGANSSFVNRLGDTDLSAESLLGDPFEAVIGSGGLPNPAIPLPPMLYGSARQNAAGIDLNDRDCLRTIEAAIAMHAGQAWHAAPLCFHASGKGDRPPPKVLHNPADLDDVLGTCVDASAADCDAALRSAHAFAPEWASLGPARRGALLLRGADALEAHRMELIALAVREAGKTIPAALAEVREAVDFLRYYATQSMQLGEGRALGIVVCISPWNFPLAIFVGQVSAALAAGNVVIAKPAEQTPLMAHRAVTLLHEAGIAPQALQLLPGSGESIGAQLVSDLRVAGVVFTGSLKVAHQINRTLRQGGGATREDPVLIAETGGQNAMIVDSTALPEQVVQDVLASAFDSAGQRCSALRVLCLQSEIAETVLDKMRGAMLELRIGNPCLAKTDIGPVIDADARLSLRAYVESFRKRSRVLMECLLLEEATRGTFVAPAVLEIDSLHELQGEVFGPVLHVLRYESQNLSQLICAINQPGYGLTMGLHSRIDARTELVTARARVGNLYVNRNMIGAVVGVQPFGGEGKSGTGPKAGGPLYLLRLQRPNAIHVRDIVVQQHSDASFANASEDDMPREERDKALKALASLTTWCRERELVALAALCDKYAKDSLLGLCVALPGPTGESNALQFWPRGGVRCIAHQLPVLLHQIAAVLATGNFAIVDAEVERLLPDDLPASVQSRIRRTDMHLHDVSAENPCLVILVEAAERTALVDPPLSDVPEGEGAIIQIIRVGLGPIAIWRLTAERAVCINTSAAGGNASLMATST
jgi:RHH-type proline utilization regulon transcriptional repressor/proline dehydrogenase/delta 1-pyrroline-5-carboxylate dehydrogenase